MAGYIGNNPSDSSVRIARQIYTTSGITSDFTFTSGYDPGYIDIYVNGERQTEGTNFTASDGQTFTIMNGGVSTGSTVEASAYKTFNVATVTLGEVTDVDDLVITGQLTSSSIIVGSAVTANLSGLNVSGVVTATSFSGDGSALTGMANTANVSTTGLNVVGVSTLGNDVIFTGATANVTWDKSEDDLVFADNARAKFGTDLDLHIYHNGSNSVIREEGTGNLNIQTTGGNVDILVNTTETAAKFISDGAVELYYNNTKRIETTSSGAITTGIHTVTVGTDLDGYKVEEGSYDTNALNGEFDFELENGHVQTHTGSTAGTYFPDFRVSSSQSLSSVMDVGDVVSATLIVTASNTAHYCTTGIKIDNSTSNVTIEWIGSAAPTAGKGAGYDIYSFTIQKTAATPAYLVIVNATDAG